MVCFNVSQLLLMGPGAVREFDFSEDFPDPAHELHLEGPIEGHARLTRTSEGVLAHSDYHASVKLECARCLEEAIEEVEGELDEEFLPTTDIHTDDDWGRIIVAHHGLCLALDASLLRFLP